MTFMINFGKWGGFYRVGNRICFGFVALTIFRFDADKKIHDWIQKETGLASPEVKYWINHCHLLTQKINELEKERFVISHSNWAKDEEIKQLQSNN